MGLRETAVAPEIFHLWDKFFSACSGLSIDKKNVLLRPVTRNPSSLDVKLLSEHVSDVSMGQAWLG